MVDAGRSDSRSVDCPNFRSSARSCFVPRALLPDFLLLPLSLVMASTTAPSKASLRNAARGFVVHGSDAAAEARTLGVDAAVAEAWPQCSRKRVIRSLLVI